MLVIEGGTTVVEWYFDGSDERRGDRLGVVRFGPETLHDIRSVTKSIVSLLFGIALAEGAIQSLDDPVLNYFPEYDDLQTTERLRIRLRDLLSMTSGLHWDERTYPYTDPRNSEIAMDLAPDRYHHILSQPIDAPPGERWTYSGGDVALIAEVIARTTEVPIEVYARQKLFEPLGITHFEWLADRNGIPYAASGLRLRPRDMATVGLLMLHQGREGGRQIVPEDWVETATMPHATVDPDPCGREYGYFWWLVPTCEPEGQLGRFAGRGNGGQRIEVIPSLDAVVVTTVGLYNDNRQGRVVRAMTLEILKALTTDRDRRFTDR